MMTRLLLKALLVLGPSICLAQSRGNPDDEAAIKKALGKSRESVEKRDADLRAGLYTEDASSTTPLVWSEGREPIREFWKDLLASGTFNQSAFKITKEKIRFLTPDLAVVDIFEEVTGQGTQGELEENGEVWSRGKAIMVLLVATGFVALLSEFWLARSRAYARHSASPRLSSASSSSRLSATPPSTRPPFSWR